MNAKERLLRCIHHEPIDRVPVSTYALIDWQEQEPSFQEYAAHIKKYTDWICFADPKKTFAGPDPVEKIEWDQGPSHFIKSVLHTPGGDLTALARRDPDVYTEWTLEHYCKDLADLDKYLSLPYTPPRIDMNPVLEEQNKIGERGLVMVGLGDPFGIAASLFKMDLLLELAVTEKEKMKYLCDVFFERYFFELREMLKGDVQEVIFNINGPEFATPPYLPPELFSCYVTPYLIKMCQAIKSAGAIPRIHCHGKIGKVLDQFALTEAMMLEPLEPCPDGDIDLADIKKRVGGQMCLLGNIEFWELERSDRQRIDRLVKDAMAAAKAGSGFILMPTTFPIHVPLPYQTKENYFQMIESVYKYGYY